MGLRRRIAEAAHIRSEGCHGRQTERKRREWTSLKGITKDECAITLERYRSFETGNPPEGYDFEGQFQIFCLGFLDDIGL